MAKWLDYIEAREGGHTDAEANQLAGYEGKTPGRTLDMWASVQLMRQQLNAWGEGPMELRRMLDSWREEQARLEGEVERRRERLSEIERQVMLGEIVLRRRE